jgi:hypothetical protein
MLKKYFYIHFFLPDMLLAATPTADSGCELVNTELQFRQGR